MLIGLGVALLLNQPMRLRGIFRTIYFLPVVTPFVGGAILWKWLYNGDYGLFNFYLLKTHLIDQPLLWLSEQEPRDAVGHPDERSGAASASRW